MLVPVAEKPNLSADGDPPLLTSNEMKAKGYYAVENPKWLIRSNMKMLEYVFADFVLLVVQVQNYILNPQNPSPKKRHVS